MYGTPDLMSPRPRGSEIWRRMCSEEPRVASAFTIVRSSPPEHRRAWLFLSGAIDVSQAKMLSETLRGLVEEGVLHLVCDADEVTVLDSTALATFRRWAGELASRGGSLRIENPSWAVQRVLDATGGVSGS